MPSSPLSFTRLSRIGGLVGLVLLVVAIPPGGDSPFFTDASHAEIVRWVHNHPTALNVEGLRTPLTMLLVASFLGILLWRTGRRGTVQLVVAGFLAANLAVDIVWAGFYFSLAKAGLMDAPDASILALYAAVQELTFTDGLCFGVAVLIVSWLALRTRTLPAPIAWIGVAVGAYHIVSVPLQVAISGTVEGPTGPISAVTFLAWALATPLALLIRPGTRDAEPAGQLVESAA